MLIFTGTYANQISGFFLDGSTGKLSPAGKAGDSVNPAAMVRHTSLPVLYAVNEWEERGAVSVYTFHRTSGQLAVMQEVPIEDAGACHAAVSPNGKYLIVTNYYSGTVLCFSLLADGQVGPLCARQHHSGHGCHPRQQSPHAHWAIFTPEGILMTADLGCDRIFLYEIDNGSGALIPYAAQPFLQLPPGTGPRSITFHPNGRFVYLCGELSSQLIVCIWSKQQLIPVQTIALRPGSLQADTLAGGVAISPDGRFLYAALRLWDGLFRWRIDPASGQLSDLKPLPCAGRHIRTLACSPCGKYLLIPYQESNQLAVWRRNQENGLLTEETDVVAVPKVSYVLVAERMDV